MVECDTVRMVVKVVSKFVAVVFSRDRRDAVGWSLDCVAMSYARDNTASWSRVCVTVMPSSD